MISRRLRRGPSALALLTLAGLAACDTATSGELDTFAGEWCTLRGLGTDDFPLPGVAYVAMTLFVQADGRLLGTGSTSPPDTETIFPARYRGDILSDGDGLIQVSDLEEETEDPGPVFSMQLTREGVRDLVGTVTGDPAFAGPIHLVRLGPRCFAE